MIRITKDILESAKKLLASWKLASKQIGVKEDKDFQIREVASVLGVEHENLKKKL